jgi:hypothetical protein
VRGSADQQADEILAAIKRRRKLLRAYDSAYRDMVLALLPPSGRSRRGCSGRESGAQSPFKVTLPPALGTLSPTCMFRYVPRYYFDWHDGDWLMLDEDGLDLPDLDTARQQAAQALA